jgi:hypothetical protein
MFEAEYIALVIKPKLDLVLQDGVDSIADLTAKFNSAFSCSVSKARVTEWLKAAGYRVSRRVQIDGPGRVHSAQSAAPLPSSGAEPPRFVPRPQPMIPPPAGIFANVPMPGFED